MSKNKWSVLYAAVNAVLVLLVQQIASGQYPIGETATSVVSGVLALVIAFVTAVSPFFDWRQATK